MKNREHSIRRGREVIRIEAKAVADLEERIDGDFARAVDLLAECRGRVIVTGVGKSGIIARKLVATFNSTGTPAMFLHPSDAVHGDLGMVRQDDAVVCISKSGDTQELQNLVPMFKRLGVPIIALAGRLQSMLAREATVVLNASVQEEACPHDLAPTSSTTATLALGDALAVALLDRREFTQRRVRPVSPGRRARSPVAVAGRRDHGVGRRDSPRGPRRPPARRDHGDDDQAPGMHVRRGGRRPAARDHDRR